ncbi:MAG: hypothetical protein AAF654_14060 [Myxococcota bacterium]
MLCALLLASLAAAPTDDIVITDMRSPKLTDAQRGALTDLVVYGVSQRKRYRKVVTMDDVRAQLGVESTKQMLGCDDVSCAAEIGAALGARYLLSSSANPLGKKLVFSLNLIDTQTQETKRALRRVRIKKESEWEGAVEQAIAELFGSAPAAAATSPAPPFKAPSKDAIAKMQLEMMVKSMTPKCLDLDVEASVRGGPALEEHTDWESLHRGAWPGTMQAMGYHYLVVAFCTKPKDQRRKAHARATEIFEEILEKRSDHAIATSVRAYLELLKRNPIE